MPVVIEDRVSVIFLVAAVGGRVDESSMLDSSEG